MSFLASQFPARPISCVNAYAFEADGRPGDYWLALAAGCTDPSEVKRLYADTGRKSSDYCGGSFVGIHKRTDRHTRRTGWAQGETARQAYFIRAWNVGDIYLDPQ